MKCKQLFVGLRPNRMKQRKLHWMIHLNRAMRIKISHGWKEIQWYGPVEGANNTHTASMTCNRVRRIFKSPDTNNTQTLTLHIQSISLFFVFFFSYSFPFATISIDTLFDWTKNKEIDWIKFDLLVHMSMSVSVCACKTIQISFM